MRTLRGFRDEGEKRGAAGEEHVNVGHQPVTAKGLSAGCRGREPRVGAQTWDREHLGGREVPSGACGEMGEY